MSEHPPRHLLEALLADAARLPNVVELRAHLAVCERCGDRLRDIESARAAFALEHSASDFARRVSAAAAARRPSPRRWLWAAAGGGGLALALAVALLMLRAPSDAAIRYRGAAVSLQAYVRAGTEVHALREGEVLPPGGQLAFTYSLSEPQHLLLLGIDDAGTVTRYFPDGDIVKSSALAAGTRQQLPVGIELDARPGRERLIALFSARPLDEASARAALASQDPREPLELAVPASQISLWFEKR